MALCSQPHLRERPEKTSAYFLNLTPAVACSTLCYSIFCEIPGPSACIAQHKRTETNVAIQSVKRFFKRDLLDDFNIASALVGPAFSFYPESLKKSVKDVAEV